MHFGSGGDVCFIVAMAVPFLESALLFVIVFSIHCMLFFSENLSLLEEKFFTEESFSYVLNLPPFLFSSVQMKAATVIASIILDGC